MGKFVAPEDERTNVGKQSKFKMTIVYKKVQIKVRINSKRFLFFSVANKLELKGRQNKCDFRVS